MDRIVKLTGEPVSKEMEDILSRLERGQYVPIDEINNTPEIKTARSFISHSTPTVLLENRKSFRANCIKKMLEFGSAVIDNEGKTQYNGSVRQEKKLDIIIGLPASGKSSALVDTISQESKSKLIDNDEAKKMIPEFNGGWGAGVVHEESQIISDSAFKFSLTRGDNIVLPKVGSNAKKLYEEYIKPAKELGYTVNVHYVDLDRNKALGRMINRFIDRGRFLDPALIDKYDNELDGNKIDRAYRELKENGLIDGYSRWNNDVKFGERPQLIEYFNLLTDYLQNALSKEEKNDADRQRDNGTTHSGNNREFGRSELSSSESGSDVAGKEYERRGILGRNDSDLSTGVQGTPGTRGEGKINIKNMISTNQAMIQPSKSNPLPHKDRDNSL